MPEANKSCDMEERLQNFLRCFNLNLVLNIYSFSVEEGGNDKALLQLNIPFGKVQSFDDYIY